MEFGRVFGIDGILIDFYKCFWDVLGEDFLEVFNGSLDEGFLFLSCRRVVLIFFFKKGDFIEIKNWRFVLFLCSDYKFFLKILVNRLLNIMNKVIYSD